jgi:apolipoprotein D and lipocalin family protein
MKLILALLLAFALPGPAGAIESHGPLEAVPRLDLQRYTGTWHEIARLPMAFEKDCVRDVTATYTLCPDGRVGVRNQCTTASGERKTADGVARRADGPAKLEVRFAPGWLSLLPFVWADYWVIAIDEDYGWAIVGEPDREALWFLSREPQVEPRMLEDLKGRARSLGYDLDALIVNPQ